MFSGLYRLMGMMLLLIISGFLMREKGIITDAGKKCLTDIILYAVLPCNIIKAFSADLAEGFWGKFLQVFIAAVLVQVLSLMVARFMYRRMPSGEKEVYQYGTACPNSGFMGNPLAEGVFGQAGLLYAAVFLIPQRVVMWTAGVSYFQKGQDKRKIYRKVLLHPCMFATYIGLIIMAFRISLPGVIKDTIISLSNCCTALTMVYIGTVLSGVDFKGIMGKNQIYFAWIRLVMIPLLVFTGGRIAGADKLAVGVCTLLSATPAGSTTSILAAKYEADEVAAAKSVVFTTALCVITIPLWSAFLLNGLNM
ncbi:MAG: AEC family transporter [Clostridiales bacterium]|nr:AEC family transporter [Clostridiales bacterium]